MPGKSLWFVEPKRIEVREEPTPKPGAGQVLVRTALSGISSGTEMLIYRGEMPRGMAADESIAALSGNLEYPLKYGYSAVGRVAALGPGVDVSWKDRLVFAFNPHESEFVASTEDVTPLPEGVSPEDAVFLPNMETAVNFVMDGRPVIGEKVVVLGQGVVGLLTTALLAMFPLEKLVTVDRFPPRRSASLELGADAAFDPDEENVVERIRAYLGAGDFYDGADLVYEVSGSPVALDTAIELTGFDGRIVAGSWYGGKRHPIDLGGRFHRGRLKLISSQVTTLSPAFSGRWDKRRRMEIAWQMLRRVRPSRLITHRFPLNRAAEAYRLLDERPQEVLQIVFTYDT